MNLVAGLALIGGVVLVNAAYDGQRPMPRFDASADAVAVDAFVLDRNRRPIRGLQPNDFTLLDNGVPQKVDVVGGDLVPLSVVLLLDTSSSVSGPSLTRLTAAAQSFLTRLGPDDRAAVVTTADTVALQTQLDDMPSDAATTLKSLDASGGTRLFDAMWATIALQHARKTEGRRSMLVVFTDGRDTASWLRRADAQSIAEQSNVVVFAVTVPRPAAPGAAPLSWSDIARWPDHTFLQALTDASGGRLIVVQDSTRIAAAFEEALLEMRTRYVLYYQPSGVERAGFHGITVNVTRRAAIVRARRGYRVPEAANRR